MCFSREAFLKDMEREVHDTVEKERIARYSLGIRGAVAIKLNLQGLFFLTFPPSSSPNLSPGLRDEVH